ALVMGGIVWATARISVPLALGAGLTAYVISLLPLQVFAPDEWDMLAPLLPTRLRGMVRAYLK
ncbi:MAG: hypothetical protein N2508_14370, partial [Anaerolineae bacterium]|nr:hypothetical protein [Anaerolineae bacterium]